MATGSEDIKQEIKRRPSNRNELVSKAVQDCSSGMGKVVKAIFLACTGSIARSVKAKRQKIRDRGGRRVTQLESKDRESKLRNAVHNLTAHSIPRRPVPTPVVAIGMQVQHPVTPPAIAITPPAEPLSSHPPDPSPRRPSLPRQQEYLTPHTEMELPTIPQDQAFTSESIFVEASAAEDLLSHIQPSSEGESVYSKARSTKSSIKNSSPHKKEPSTDSEVSSLVGPRSSSLRGTSVGDSTHMPGDWPRRASEQSLD